MKVQDKNKHQRRAEQLGMSYGNASSKLRKQLLFRYVVDAGDNLCFGCGQEITNIDDLSVEHIQPWENRNVDLFWDLDNIAFSHIKCNKPHAYRSRDKNEQGQLRCTKCKEYKDEQEFSLRSSRPTQKHSHCKSCRKEADKRQSHTAL